MNKLRVLVACEESQAVTIELRKLGHEAYSCDIEPCSGGHPEWHIQGDVLPLLRQDDWDLIVAHPPCTDLAVSGAAWFEKKRADGRQQASIAFFMRFTDIPCQRVAIENPIGIMSTVWRRPDQIIQPWWFGDEFNKTTCLWLKGLPPLRHTKWVGSGEWIQVGKKGGRRAKWFADAFKLSPEERSRVRSKTFPGIAEAMAVQWGSVEVFA